jgi:hypothetical protein
MPPRRVAVAAGAPRAAIVFPPQQHLSSASGDAAARVRRRPLRRALAARRDPRRDRSWSDAPGARVPAAAAGFPLTACGRAGARRALDAGLVERTRASSRAGGALGSWARCSASLTSSARPARSPRRWHAAQRRGLHASAQQHDRGEASYQEHVERGDPHQQALRRRPRSSSLRFSIPNLLSRRRSGDDVDAAARAAAASRPRRRPALQTRWSAGTARTLPPALARAATGGIDRRRNRRVEGRHRHTWSDTGSHQVSSFFFAPPK